MLTGGDHKAIGNTNGKSFDGEKDLLIRGHSTIQVGQKSVQGMPTVEIHVQKDATVVIKNEVSQGIGLLNISPVGIPRFDKPRIVKDEEISARVIVPEVMLFEVRMKSETRVPCCQPADRWRGAERTQKNVMQTTRNVLVTRCLPFVGQTEQIESNVRRRCEWPRHVAIDKSQKTNDMATKDDQEQDDHSQEHTKTHTSGQRHLPWFPLEQRASLPASTRCSHGDILEQMNAFFRVMIHRCFG